MEAPEAWGFAANGLAARLDGGDDLVKSGHATPVRARRDRDRPLAALAIGPFRINDGAPFAHSLCFRVNAQAGWSPA